LCTGLFIDFRNTEFRGNIQNNIHQEYTFVTLHPIEVLQAIHSARRWSIVTAQLRVQPRLYLRLSLPRIPSCRRDLSGWMRFATVSQRSVSRTGTTRYTCKKIAIGAWWYFRADYTIQLQIVTVVANGLWYRSFLFSTFFHCIKIAYMYNKNAKFL